MLNIHRGYNELLQLLLLLLGCCAAAAVGRQIELQRDGRYRNVLVTIGDDVPEDWQLIQRIKEAFSAASRHLSLATQFHSPSSFAFGDVRILIPKSWNSKGADAVATWEKPDVGSFRIGNRGQRIPFTVQPGGCGDPGIFVNLNAGHLKYTDPELVGKQLVHEFGHLRWGLFNEFNDENGPHWYLDKSRIYPVACSRGIRGKFRNPVTGSGCRFDRNTLTSKSPCNFIPNQQQSAQASLLYANYLSAVDQFCTKSSDPNLDHNSKAPNPQNRMCRGKSARYVMQRHSDFRKSLDVTETHTKVNFTVVSPVTNRKISIVMDVSGSMEGEPLAKLKIAARSLLLDQLENGIHCGLISFNRDPTVLKNLQKLQSPSVRQDYWNVVSKLRSDGGTAIGNALVRAMRMLGANITRLSKHDTGYIVLLTDGEETVRDPYSFNTAISKLRQTSIVVDTIAIGNKADNRLHDLSHQTGGKAHFVTYRTAANDLIEAMADLVRDRAFTDQKPIDIFSSGVSPGFRKTFFLDKSIAKSLSVQLTSTDMNDIRNANLQLISPSRKVYDKKSQDFYEKDVNSGVISITLPGDAETGQWTVSDTNPSARRRRRSLSRSLSLSVSSKPAESAPIILDGSVSHSKIQLNASTRIAIYATLAQGSELLKGATISASIESDQSIEANIVLRDDGVGADALENDGVYSGFVPVSVQEKQEYNVRLLCVKPVERVATAGKFEIESVDSGSLASIPPSAISDLKSEIDLRNQIVHLTWTAVGAKRMDGKASRYKIKVCNSDVDIYSSTSDGCKLLTSSAELKPAGQMMRVTVTAEQLSETNKTMTIAVLAENANGISSELSNIIAVQLILPENILEIEKHAALTAVPSWIMSSVLCAVVMVMGALVRQ